MGANAVPAIAANGVDKGPATGRIVVVAAIYLVIVALAAVIPLVSTRNPFFQPTPELQAYRMTLWVVWLVVLVETLRRQPSSPLWKLIFAYGVSSQIWAFGYLHDSLIWSVSMLFGFLYVPIFVLLMLAFPSGHLRQPWDRVIVALYFVVIAVFSVVQRLVSELPLVNCTVDCLRNVFLVWPNDDVAEFISIVSVVIPVALSPLVLIRLWRHWRDANWIGRQVLLPVLIAVPIVVAATSLEFLSDRLHLEPLQTFFASGLEPIPMFVLPIGMLAGVLRLRLNRGRTADLLVELGRGVPTGGLRDLLARALGDPTLQLAFAAPTGDGFVDSSGRRIDLPADEGSASVSRLERDGELLGILIHDPAIDAEDPGLVTAVGSAASLALENERLAAQVRAQLEEVRASRARIVEAGDAERRRVERDLHDGAQQRLVALAMRLQLARETTSGASALLDEATSELQAAIGEVRDLARGLHPPILTEAGLAAAVDALAERAPLPVTVSIPATRYPSAIEAAAYFVVAESLTNVVRHARATRAYVTATETDGSLVIVIRDDGRGGADAAMGTGLAGLRDRIAVAGGTLSIASPSGQGTILTAVLPTG